MFACPNCRDGLTRTQNEYGVYWFCGDCGGRAVNMPVLRRAIRRDYVNALWQRALTPGVARHRLCPACGRRMAEVPAPVPAGDLCLDVCKTCEFVWFDAQEFEAAPHAPQPVVVPEKKELPQKAREAIALYEVQQMAERQRAEELPDESWKLLPAFFGLPVEDEVDQLRHWPWLTWGLAGVISVVFLLTFSNLSSIVDDWGLVSREVFRQGGLTLLTSFFLHGGLWHWLSNVYFLLVFGDNVEDYLGWRRWVLLIVGASLAGDFLHVLAAPSSGEPCIGASGGISGLIAFYALQFPHARLGFLFRFGLVPLRWIWMPAWGAFVLWLLLQFLGALQQLAGFSRVSALAHLGGALVGVGLWFLWRDK